MIANEPYEKQAVDEEATFVTPLQRINFKYNFHYT
jgi:hypothetical protein